MKNLFLLLIVACSSLQAAAQTNLDSLWGVWIDESQSDTNRLKAIDDFVNLGYVYTKPDSAFYFAQLHYDFAKDNGYKKHVSKALVTIGTAYYVKGDLTKTLNYFEQSLDVNREIGDQKGIAGSLNNLGVINYSQGNHEKALEYYQQGLVVREEMGNKTETAKVLNNIGAVYFAQADYKKTLEYYKRSLKIKQEIDDKKGAAMTLNNLGNVYSAQGDFASAVNYYAQSMAIMEEVGDKQGLAATLNNVGSIYNDQGDDDKAVQNYLESLAIREEMKDKEGIAASFNNLGNVYNGKGELDKALDYYSRSLVIKEEMGNKQGVVATLNNIGNIHLKKKDLAKGLEYFQRSLTISEEIGDKKGATNALVGFGKIFSEQGNLNSAIEYGSRGLDIAQEMGGVLQIKSAAELLFNTYKANGQLNKALPMHELFIQMRDSVMSEQNQREVLRQEYKYVYQKESLADSLEFAKKEAIMTERSAKQKIGLGAAGGGLLLILALAFSIYNGKMKSDQLLLNILPEETAQELKDKGYSDAQLIDQVTVLFTDFKGFTALSEQVTPKELVADLHECFSAFDNICQKFGIEKIKTIGDAYMAAGGLPTPNDTHPQDVVKAALEMAKIVEDGKARKQASGEPFFEVRIGVHTGPVVAGIVGVKKFQYDIWGDTVNTASRMESSGEVGQVNISKATYELLKDDSQLTFESRGKIEAKGKGEMEMYFVEALG